MFCEPPPGGFLLPFIMRGNTSSINTPQARRMLQHPLHVHVFLPALNLPLITGNRR
jgi:hypothetical protein